MELGNLTDLLIVERRLSHNILKDIPLDRGDFRPAEGMMTTAGQLAHIGAFDEWLVQGLKHGNWAFDTFTDRPEKSVEEAMAFLDHARIRLLELVKSMGKEGINSPIGSNPVFMPEMQKGKVIMMTHAHECHHRGQLVVYLRMMGITPGMLYC